MSRFAVVLCAALLACVAATNWEEALQNTNVNGRQVRGVYSHIVNALIMTVEAQMNQEQKDKVNAIFNNPALTKQQLQDQIIDAFKSFGEPLNSAFDKSGEEFEHAVKIDVERTEEAVKKLSPEAQNVFNQFTSIVNNKTLTNQQETDQIKMLFDSASPAVQEELESID